MLIKDTKARDPAFYKPVEELSEESSNGEMIGWIVSGEHPKSTQILPDQPTSEVHTSSIRCILRKNSAVTGSSASLWEAR